MKKIFLYLSIITPSSCKHEWFLRSEIKGQVFNSDNKPIDALIATVPVEGEQMEKVVKTNEGGFYFPKITIKEWSFLGMEKPKAPPTTNKIVIVAKRFKNDTIDYTDNYSKNGVINLGKIILEKEKP
ncbi:hypothetical protein BWK59_10715 [Flavobacterium davisii]|uniref:Carboxypeptidase regulatory-like domain-containing protein n=1 Tax=Flavobacterium davisii TaxID=2906077 RepID=A0A246GGW0_9FLAO|nr:hypothetical protein [Flavobacterium davisii]OWP83401.1 hypothetical protein BWK59_10715 [Flavobacterium davisii]